MRSVPVSTVSCGRLGWPLIFCLALLNSVVVLLPTDSEAREWVIDDPVARRVRALADARKYQAVLDTVPALIDRALARGDSLQLGRLICARGQGMLGTGQVAASLVDLLRAERLAEANADTLTWLTALGVRAFSLSGQGRFDEAIDLARRQSELAALAHDPVGEAFARLSMGYASINLRRNEEARVAYSVAAENFQAAGMTAYQLTALVGLGRALGNLGEEDGSRDVNLSVVQLSRQVGDLRNEADATNNLGMMEMARHRYDRAADYFERAYTLQLKLGNDLGATAIMFSYAITQSWMGLHDDAAGIIEQVRDMTRGAGATLSYDGATLKLANVNFNRGATGAAVALYREVLAKPSSLELRLEAAEGLGWSLVRLDSIATAKQVVTHAEEWCEDAGVELWNSLRLLGCVINLRAGSFDEALERARAYMLNRTTILGEVKSSALMAQCYTAIGELDSAHALLGPAVSAFEQYRVRSTELSWREISSASSYRLLVDSVLGVFSAARASRSPEDRMEAANLLLRLKARNILERLSVDGDRQESMSPLTIADVQRRLGSGDLLLDYYVGQERMSVLVVSEEQVQLVDLSDELKPARERASNWIETLASPEGGERKRRSQDAAARELAIQLLEPTGELVESAERVHFIPDGFLTAIPLGALMLGEGESEPLVIQKEVAQLPTASLVARERSAESEPGGILALLERGSGLAGARREVAALRRAYEDVVTLEGLPGGLGKLRSASVALHVAAHTDIQEDLDWFSGIRLDSRANGLEQADGSPSSETHLRAKDILALELPQRLAFLASCESGLGSQRSGTGVLGLSTAFLIAQVPSVVATLWRVDDRATAGLVEIFYEGLADGLTVAAALRNAQIQIRSLPETSDPYYWAGFFLVGNPDTLVPLHRRHSAQPGRWLLLVAAVLAGFGLSIAWRQRGRTSPHRA